MFPSVSRCASAKMNSGPSTNMAAVGHLCFFLVIASPQKLLDGFEWNLLLVFASMPSCASTEKNPVRRQIWLFDSRFGLNKISYWLACYRMSSKSTSRICFRSWSECSPQCLIVQVPKKKKKKNLICRKTCPPSAIFDISYHITSETTGWIWMKRVY